MFDKMQIIIPDEIYVLKPVNNQDIVTDREEFSLYFANIIYPYSDMLDIMIKCEYGQNLGNCWRINSFDGVADKFPLTIKVLEPYGKPAAEKTLKVKLCDREYKKEVKLLFIGDSMTRSEVYVSQAVNKSIPCKTIGSRSIAKNVRHDGMGGWQSGGFLTRYKDEGNGISQFVFPVNVSGRDYYGDINFANKCKNNGDGKYSYRGFNIGELSDGMYFYNDGLYRRENGKDILVEKEPQMEFDFGKYLERMGETPPDIVSLLFGANDMYNASYDTCEEFANALVSNLEMLVCKIKETDSSIKVIINTSPLGAEQYIWGIQCGCAQTSKQYNYCIKMAAKAIIEKFDNRREERIFVSPTTAVCDPVYGYGITAYKGNQYITETQMHASDRIHPNEVGYKQMGDALSAVIAQARK